jgi:hypothetical protein
MRAMCALEDKAPLHLQARSLRILTISPSQVLVRPVTFVRAAHLSHASVLREPTKTKQDSPHAKPAPKATTAPKSGLRIQVVPANQVSTASADPYTLSPTTSNLVAFVLWVTSV